MVPNRQLPYGPAGPGPAHVPLDAYRMARLLAPQPQETKGSGQNAVAREMDRSPGLCPVHRLHRGLRAAPGNIDK